MRRGLPLRKSNQQQMVVCGSWTLHVFGREGRNAEGPIAEPRAKRAGDKKGPGALPPLAPKTRGARLPCTLRLRRRQVVRLAGLWLGVRRRGCHQQLSEATPRDRLELRVPSGERDGPAIVVRDRFHA